MTSRGAPSLLELRFSIDDRPGVLRAADISAALGLLAEHANSGGYRDWPQSTQREMVHILARDTTAGPVLFKRQLPPQMLLIDHLLRTSQFPLQHYVQRRGAILEALYQISEGFWFSPSELVMTSLLHFEDKVHRKGLARAESMMSLKVIYFQSIFLIDFYIKRPIYMQESGIDFTKLLCSRKFKRKQKLQ